MSERGSRRTCEVEKVSPVTLTISSAKKGNTWKFQSKSGPAFHSRSSPNLELLLSSSFASLLPSPIRTLSPFSQTHQSPTPIETRWHCVLPPLFSATSWPARRRGLPLLPRRLPALPPLLRPSRLARDGLHLSRSEVTPPRRASRTKRSRTASSKSSSPLRRSTHPRSVCSAVPLSCL